MTGPEIEADKIGRRGWRQGSFLPPALFPLLSQSTGLVFRESEHIAIVISQDCDVVQRSLAKEPYVEVIRGRLVQTEDGNLMQGKNPRSIQIPITSEGDLQICQLSIHDRGRLNRGELSTVDPDNRLALQPRDIRLLGDWVGNRYTRSAFPDAFNQRLEDPSKKADRRQLRALLEANGRRVAGIFVRLSSERELEPHEDYGIIMWIVIESEIFDNEEALFRLEEELLIPFTRLLGGFPGIRVDDCTLTAKSEFSLEDLEETRRLELWDSITNADDE